MDTLIASTEEQIMNSSVVERNDAPPPLCSSFERPNKESAIQQKLSRYAKTDSFADSDSDETCS